jgi:hypothetical protein
MTRTLALLLILTGPALADTVLPSGQPVEPLDTLTEDQAGETVLILRYVADGLSRELDDAQIEAAMADLDHLCATDGVALADDATDRVIVTMMSAPLPRGMVDPDVTQFFGLYSVADGTCIWEAF